MFMRIVVLGGTRFIGRALVGELHASGHELLLVHRGVHDAGDLPEIEHLHTDRRNLAAHRGSIARFRPDAAIDMSAMAKADAEAATAALDGSVSLLVASSADVYRACTAVHAGTVTDPVPLTEDAALRSEPPPDADEVPPGWDFDPARYEKLDVERIYLERGAIVCRLPMVYGEHDYKRREEFILRRVRAGRTRIPVGAGSFRWSRGYAPEIARGLRLALERADAGDAFNLAEPEGAPVGQWVGAILEAARHDAALVRVADEHVPEDLGLTTTIPQDWWVDSTKAREQLGWTHAPWRPCVARSVAWHLENPPAGGTEDFGADDAALHAAHGGG